MTKDAHERHRGGKIAEEPLGPSGNPWSKEEYAAMDAAFRGAMLDAIEHGKEHIPEPSRRSRS